MTDVHHEQHDESGFTLVETLVALAILALLVAMIPGSLRLGARAWESAARLDDDSEVIAARQFLAQSVAASTPLYANVGESSLALALHGDAATLEWIAPSAGHTAGGGLYRYRLETVDVADTRRRGLLLRMAPYRAGEPATALRTAGGEERILTRRADAVSIRYFGRATSADPPAWHAAWTRPDAQPALIEFAFDGAPGLEGRPLAIPLRLSGG